LGQAYQFRDGGGISMEFAVRSAREIERLELGGLTERLDYVRQSLRLLKQTLGPDTALIGFAGSPWTLACFMVEGGSASQFRAAASLLDQEPVLFGRLLETLTRAVAAYLRLQLEAGVDAIQIFDTLAGLLPRERFQEASARWLTDIVRGLREGGPTHPPAIVFSKGMNDNWEALLGTGASVFSVDSSVRLRDLRARLPGDVALQGNLDPALLRTSSEQVTDAARELLEDLRGCRGHIFNLGHGVPPDARLECLEALASTVQGFT
jgi:uroporphyrinogen decarboxylase